MTLRDDLLPTFDMARQIIHDLGLRRFAVTIRRRTWSGRVEGEGVATDYDLGITPAPRVRDVTARDLTLLEAEQRAAGQGDVVGNLYRVSSITPRYTQNGVTGGYLAEQLRLWPNTDTGAVDNLICLVGDDGLLRECLQVTFEQDRAFGYSMLVKEIDRPRVQMQSIAISAASGTTVRRGSAVSFVATGTFNGGATSIVTTLCSWTSSAPGVATIDIYGNVTGVSTGTATLTAVCLGITATLSITVV